MKKVLLCVALVAVAMLPALAAGDPDETHAADQKKIHEALKKLGTLGDGDVAIDAQKLSEEINARVAEAMSQLRNDAGSLDLSFGNLSFGDDAWFTLGDGDMPHGWFRFGDGENGGFAFGAGEHNGTFALTDLDFNLLGETDAAGKFSFSFGTDQDGKRQSIVITSDSDGNQLVKVDGEPVDSAQVVIENGRIVVKNAAGDVLVDLDNPARDLTVGGLPLRGLQLNQKAERPSIGITMEVPSEALAFHTDIDRETTALVTSVLEDMSAAAAGLQKFDLITHIDGELGASIQQVAKAVQAKEDGEEITLRVLRRGRAYDIRIPVEVREVSTFPQAGLPLLKNLPLLHQHFKQGGGGLHLDPKLFVSPKVQFKDFSQAPGLPGKLKTRIDKTAESDTDDAMKRLEDRLERLEKMLEKLGDRKEF